MNLGLNLGLGTHRLLAGGWTPAQIAAGQRLAWYDAMDAATITLNGGNAAQINDKWGSGRNQVQATAANQPAYSATAINGRPGLVAATADRWMVAQFAPLALSGATLFYVARRTNVSQMFSLGSSTSAAPFLRVATSNLSTQARDNTGSQVNSPILTGTLPGVVMNAFAADRAVAGFNGTTAETASAITPMTIDRLALFTNPVTTSLGVGNNAIGEFGEGLLLGPGLTLDDRQRIEGYLAWKWGFQANLPSGHPFFSAAP